MRDGVGKQKNETVEKKQDGREKERDKDDTAVKNKTNYSIGGGNKKL